MHTILIIDDEESIRNSLTGILQDEGFSTLIAESGDEGLLKLQEEKPDLIFLDVMMPDMTGDEVSAQLKEDEELSRIKFIFMTAIVTKDETENMGTNIGGNEFLAKPVKTDELLATIERVLGE